jgi:hypothetical protein
MGLEIDDQEPALSPATRRLLVEAVAHAPVGESEPPWLEWKGRISSLESWAPRIAIYILGFANRPVHWAQRYVSGWAYLILGVEPGTVHGVTPADTADLQKWVAPYVGPKGPQWDPFFVDVSNGTVLVIAVPPPRQGDPAYPVRKSFQGPVGGKQFSIRDGDFYVRVGSETRPARSAEWDMLEARKATAPAMAASIANRSSVLRTIDCHEVGREDWLARERERLMAGVDDRPVVSDGMLAAYARIFGESRSAAEYSESVEKYLGECRRLWYARLTKLAAVDHLATLKLAVTNESDHNFAHNELILEIGGRLAASWEGAWARLSDPEPPRPWGEQARSHLWGLPDYSVGLDTSRLGYALHLGEIASSGATTTIRYPEFDLRPEETVELDPVDLAINDEHTGSSLPAKWRLTSKSVSGVLRGELKILVSEECRSPL